MRRRRRLTCNVCVHIRYGVSGGVLHDIIIIIIILILSHYII